MMSAKTPQLAAHWVLATTGFLVLGAASFFGIDATLEAKWTHVLVVIFATAFGTWHGASVVAVVFRIADPPRRPQLDMPGSAPRTGDDLTPPPGTMRGGAMIGVLERAATIVALACGQPGVVAVVVAVKAIGRFGELDGALMRERFLVGSLASIAIASAWGLAAWLVIS